MTITPSTPPGAGCGPTSTITSDSARRSDWDSGMGEGLTFANRPGPVKKVLPTRLSLWEAVESSALQFADGLEDLIPTPEPPTLNDLLDLPVHRAPPLQLDAIATSFFEPGHLSQLLTRGQFDDVLDGLSLDAADELTLEAAADKDDDVQGRILGELENSAATNDFSWEDKSTRIAEALLRVRHQVASLICRYSLFSVACLPTPRRP
ncbi:hypothetical protein QBC32DRAFT_354294 [Pseudoneurospora amorphoporcata]|uniref:Uncharacterized protein n=1 Tax=Pseudoneurospora amorphoporcata TaxID=241081 RepID=A0AAN6SBE3_9PEZI|nr:hypothetical protein QBC32DRAFT_354294 [Pseudoneurospora amorphoporcata]